MTRDKDGIRHITGCDEHDTLFLHGWFQAEDRLFQLDVLRRTASGTLAEVIGSDALASDVQLRTLGLRRAAERSLSVLNDATRAGMQAYADGVNAWVARHQLPQEYGLLSVTRFEPWTPLDTVVVGKALAFQLSFDDDTAPTLQYLEYQKKLAAINPRLGPAMFFLDTFRSAPFSNVATVPDATASQSLTGAKAASAAGETKLDALSLDAATVDLLKRHSANVDRVPFLKSATTRREREIGNNEWAVSGAFTRDGRALIANDPHLSLDIPANFYDVHLVSERDGLDVIGSAIPGVPWVVLGQNRHVTWGETVTNFDVTDYYQEQIVADPKSPSGLSTVYQGALEPIIPIPQTYKVNLRDGVADHIVPVPAGGGIPAAVLIVPRRNNGPILQLDQQAGTAISLQYTGFSATREVDSIRLINYARNVSDFTGALQYFDFGSENFIYGDIQGNVGYFSSGEVPIREDLQSLTVRGSPPWMIRDGRGGNEWLKISTPDQTDGTGYQYLAFNELPQALNPAQGVIVNANNDPAGVTLDNDPLNQLRADNNGLYYLAYTFDTGLRAGRITEMLSQQLTKGPVDRDDIKAMQADVTLFDAKTLVPYIVAALNNARRGDAPQELAALGNDAAIVESIERLQKWNFTAPTGVQNGYDAELEDRTSIRQNKRAFVANSVAATLYSVWRGRVITNGLDRALTDLGLPLPADDMSIKAIALLLKNSGIGQSSYDYFKWTALASPADRRDFVILRSLKDTLQLLSSPAFAAAFQGSTRQEDYLWGKLHRHSFDALLGGPFSIPGSTPAFSPTFPDLTGLAVDGGYGTVDASGHSVRAASADAFMFNHGPNRRYVGSVGNRVGSIAGETILPGGTSGVVGNPYYANLLDRYLRNQTYPMRAKAGEVSCGPDNSQVFTPALPAVR